MSTIKEYLSELSGRSSRPTRRLLKARSLFSRLAARRSRPESPPAPSRSASRAAGHSAPRARINRLHRMAKRLPLWSMK